MLSQKLIAKREKNLIRNQEVHDLRLYLQTVGADRRFQQAAVDTYGGTLSIIYDDFLRTERVYGTMVQKATCNEKPQACQQLRGLRIIDN